MPIGSLDIAQCNLFGKEELVASSLDLAHAALRDLPFTPSKLLMKRRMELYVLLSDPNWRKRFLLIAQELSKGDVESIAELVCAIIAQSPKAYCLDTISRDVRRVEYDLRKKLEQTDE